MTSNDEISRHFVWADRFCIELDKLSLSTRTRNMVARAVLWRPSDAFRDGTHMMSFHEWILAVKANPARVRHISNVGKLTANELLKAIDVYLLSSKSGIEYGYA